MTGYEEKYYCLFYNISGDEIRISLQLKDYSGTSSFLRCKEASLIQNYKGFFEPVIGAGLEWIVMNQEEDWEDLDELLICQNREWYVEATYTKGSIITTIFTGFLLAEEQEQSAHPYSEINLKASNQLSLLEHISKPVEDDIACYKGAMVNKIIAYISPILLKTGMECDIYVNTSLYAVGSTQSILFHDTYINKYLFCDEDLTYDDLLTAINKILKPFTMYVYQYDSKWFIERLFDYTSPRTYVIFDPLPDDNYSYTTSVVTPLTINKQAKDFEYVDLSQRMKYQEGYKNITLTCNVNSRHNMLNESFIDATSKSYSVEGNNTIGKWFYDSTGTITIGDGDVTYNSDGSTLFRGIYAKIYVYKGGDLQSFSFTARRKLCQDELDIIAETGKSLVGTKFVFNIIDWDHSPSPEQINYDENAGNNWNTGALNLNSGSVWDVGSYIYDEEGGYYYWEMSFDVDISDLDGDGWHILEIRLMDAYYYMWDNTTHEYSLLDPTYCKIKVTQEVEEGDDIELNGATSLNYLNTLKETIYLFDTIIYTLTNLMMIDSASYDDIPGKASTLWTDARTRESIDRELPLQELYLESLFQQFRKPRRMLEATIKCTELLKPMDILQDAHFTRDSVTADFVIMGFDLDLNNMQYDITALEVVADDGEIIV
jgi:hypothetical protein